MIRLPIACPQPRPHLPRRVLAALQAIALACALAGCGGNSGSGSSSMLSVVAPGAPQATGSTATDGFNRFNFRRQQAGLPPVVRNATIDAAAQGHSDYQRLNNEITHVQTPGRPGFTGAAILDRLRAAGYPLPERYAYGEVIASRSNADGAGAAEDLIGAIYHRFIVFEPMFREIGTGAATGGNGMTWFTADFMGAGMDGGIARGTVVAYPAAGQTNVPLAVNSDEEEPDPVPNQNRIGYPVSVHANLLSVVAVQSFALRPRGGADLPARLLQHETDANVPVSAAAIVPLDPLAAGTTYDVRFEGTVDGIPVSRSWSFTTQ